MRISDSLSAGNRAFTLIELLVVVILILIIYGLILPVLQKEREPIFAMEKLYNTLYPEGEFRLYGNKVAVLKTKEETRDFKLSFEDVEVYRYIDDRFEPIIPKREGDKLVLFDYTLTRGIGKSCILKIDNRYYVFKPFGVRKVSSFEEARILFMHPKLQPFRGDIL